MPKCEVIFARALRCDMDCNMNEVKCVFCGGAAKITGRWYNARVVCRYCGMEGKLEDYRDQMEERMDQVWEFFGKEESWGMTEKGLSG